MYVITTAKEKAEILFFYHGFETANQYCNLELDTINKENEKEILLNQQARMGADCGK